MTKDDIIRMAEQAGMKRCNCDPRCHLHTGGMGTLTYFADLVATAEREACAGIEVHLTTPDRDYTNMSPLDAYEIALMDAAMAFREAIRARGQQ